MVQAMDHEAVEGDEVVERTCKLWIREQSKEILMVQAIEGAIDGTSDGSRSIRRRYGSGCCRSKHRCNWKEVYDDDRMMI